LRYFITFACYGARLHGDESGSVDRSHNLVGSPLLEPDSQRVVAECREMLQDPYVLDHASRAVVLAAIQRHCALRGWNLLAAHVRSNHLHAIVESETRPERIMNEFKSYASRELNRLGVDSTNRKRWARHGSTRWLWRDDDVRSALEYVIDEQGEAMALFVAEAL
jgi:REP element-mobilizing transposase RayT